MIDFPKVFQEIGNNAQKLQKGYEVLQGIEEVDVATAPKELVWEQDHIKMYRYKTDKTPKCKIPCLVSFALMNRQTILDLQPDRSLVRRLLDEGLEVYIMDWGYPERKHQYLTMEDYILGYFNDAVDFLRAKHNMPKINLLSICQSGTFSMIYSSINPEKVNSLTTFVAPYDFSGNECMLYQWTKDIDVDAMVDSMGLITGEMMDEGFAMLKPSMNISKYLGVMNNLDNEPKLMNFLRMEQWKADLPALPGELFRKYIKDLFRDNKLIKGEFELGKHKVDLKNMTAPFLNVYATHDTIIPNSSTLPIMDKVGSKHKETFANPGGHIGVFVGSRAQKELAPAVAKFVMKHSK